MFAELTVIDDPTPRSGPLNMAIDEVLLGTAGSAVLRFYRWNAPSVSFGYFVRFAEAREIAGDRATVRRWTGGGIVPHGEDLTYSIMIPASDPAFTRTSISIYENVHRALCRALRARGDGSESTVAALYERRSHQNSTVMDRRCNDCFANPVRADVMVNGSKIAGAAQRKTRHGLLHQGSIQRANLDERFRNAFATLLGIRITPSQIEAAGLNDAEELAERKYATGTWQHRR